MTTSISKPTLYKKDVSASISLKEILYINNVSNFLRAKVYSHYEVDVLGNSFIITGVLFPSIIDTKFDVIGDIFELNNTYFLKIKNSKVSYIRDNDAKHSKTKLFLKSFPFSFCAKDVTKIIKYFGDDTISIILSNPSELYSVENIDLNKVSSAINNITVNKNIVDVSNFLQSLYISPSYATGLIDFYGDDTMKVLTTEPCKPGFEGVLPISICKYLTNIQNLNTTTNQTALSIFSAFQQFESLGHVCVPIDIFINSLLQQTKYTEKQIKAALRYCYINKYIKYKIVSNVYYIYRISMYQSEISIAEEIFRLSGTNKISKKTLDNSIDKIQNDENIKFSPEQREAIVKVFQNNVSIITGPPGTGKTTCLSAIVKIFKKLSGNSSILLCAPTGKAATRMTESTGFEAFTVHHALGMTPIFDDSDIFESNLVLGYDLIVLDEASMLDTEISAIFFKAIKTGARVVLLGDPNQLPSVGAGDVLAQLIQSNKIAVTNLNLVYRQSGVSSIALNAEKMRNLDNNLIFDNSFKFIPANNEEEARDIALNNLLSISSISGIQSVSLLTPYRKKTQIGCDNLNAVIEPFFNNDKLFLSDSGKIFKKGDRVICTKNFLKKKICNGSIGVISEIHSDNFSVDFGDGVFIKFNLSDLHFFDLAYANTVHKSQGSEYDNVILIVMPEHLNMLSNNIIYTGVTRAKKNVIIVGDKETFLKSILKKDENKRYSFLSLCINEVFQTYNPVSILTKTV